MCRVLKWAWAQPLAAGLAQLNNLPQKGRGIHLNPVRGTLESQDYFINYTTKQILVSYSKEFSLGLISLQRSLKLQKKPTKQTKNPFYKDKRSGSGKVIIRE